MSYKTILVHCNDKRRINALLAPTLSVASASHSHVIGLSVVPPVSVIATGLDAPPIVIDAHCELYRQELPAMRGEFEAVMSGKPLTSEWRDMDAGVFGVADVVLEQGRTADLIIAPQIDQDWPGSQWLDAADRLALESGRPVLMIPNGRASAQIATRVLVAWNGRREAARAVFDALPLLKQATAIKVVSIADSSEEVVQRPSVDICDALHRHGVKAGKTDRIAAAAGAGPQLMAEADAFDADLVVMGCYGHSRLREFIFGGATRHFLQKTRVPVLMSH